MRIAAALLVAVACVCGVPRTAPAATRPAPFLLEDALGLSTFSQLTWSHDGRRLACVIATPDTAEGTTNSDLWLLDPERGEGLRLTRHPRPDVSPTFSPGSDTLAFVATRGDDSRPGIWMMSLRGGEPWSFGAADEAIGEVHWSPDGRYLAYVKTDTLARNVREWRKKKWDHVVEEERLQYPHVWVAEIATGKKRQLTRGAQYVWNVRWSPDGRRLAYLTSPTGKPEDGNRVDIGVVAVAGGASRVLGAIGTAFAWSPDSRWIAWASTARREVFVAKSDLWVAAAQGGAPRNLTADFDEDGQQPAWNPTSDTLYFHAQQGVTTVLAAIALPASGAAPRLRLLLDRQGIAGAVAIAASGRAAWVQSDPTHPDQVWVADHPALRGRAVTAFDAHTATRALATTREVTWTNDDGVRCGGLLVRPPGVRPNTPLPTLVWLHGGPYGDRAQLEFRPLEQYLAGAGYQIFMPNFRSSGGYGTKFMVRTRADWGGQDWRDVVSGLDSLERARVVDPRRLGLYGRSYGGYLTAWGITQTGRFDAACVTAGAVDLAALWGTSDVQSYRAWEMGGLPWDAPEPWRRSSPITHIANVRTPTLILAFDEDRRIPVGQGFYLHRALLARGVPTQFVHYPREPHVPREYRHRADQYARMRDWFARWIR